MRELHGADSFGFGVRLPGQRHEHSGDRRPRFDVRGRARRERVAFSRRTDVMLYRLGLQFVVPDSYSIGGNDNHPIEPYPGATAFEWGWEFAPSQNGKMTPLWNTAGGGRRYFATDGLNKSQFYWLEWKFLPTGSAGVYKSRMRFVDVNGTVILTDADLRESGLNHTWTQDDPSLTLDDLALRSLTVGDNGPGSWSVVTPGTVFNRFSTVAVGKSNAANAWIGPYVPGEHT
jgi:hypothetical protein